jgi:hypothetical protein
MRLIVASAEIAKRTARLSKVAVFVDTEIHLLACSVLAHVAKHRDTTLVTNLFMAMPKSAKRPALAKWFGAFAPMEVTPNTGAVKLAKMYSEKWEVFTAEFPRIIEQAKATPFWDYKPETVKDDVTFKTAVTGLAKLLKSEQLTDDTERDMIARLLQHAELMAARRMLANVGEESPDMPVIAHAQEPARRVAH